MNIKDPRVRNTILCSPPGPYQRKDEWAILPEQPICAQCRGNIQRGAWGAGTFVQMDKGELTDKPCAYCGAVNVSEEGS